MTLDRQRPRNERNDEPDEVRRGFLKGAGALGLVTLAGLSIAEAASTASKIPSVDGIIGIVKKRGGLDQTVREIMGSDVQTEIKTSYEAVDSIMGGRRGAKELPVEERLGILRKVDRLKLDAERVYKALRVDVDESFSLYASDAQLKKIVEEKIRPKAVELENSRDELIRTRDDLNKRFPQ